MKNLKRFNRFLSVLIIIFALGVSASSQSLNEYADMIRRHCYDGYTEMYREGGKGAFKFPFLVPGSKSYSNVLWDWDSWLSDIALREILNAKGDEGEKSRALKYEQGCVLNYLYYTDSDGYMPMVIDSNTDPRLIKPKDFRNSNMHKPVIAQHAAFITEEMGGDASWLGKENFSRMKAFILNYSTYHRHADTGLYYWQDDLAIGVDNDPSTFFRPKKSSGSIFLNCLMYKELLAMSYLAERLGLKADAKQCGNDAALLGDNIRRHCWDEKDGMYYSVDLNLRAYTGEKEIIFGHPMVLHEGAPRDYACLIQRLGVWSGFMAMWAGVATKEQAERMVRENLLDSRTFWAPYGVRTLSKMEKMYSLRASHNPSNWCGPIWGVSNYMVYEGLKRYGYETEARELADKTITLFGSDLKLTGTLHEYYNPETGEGIINPGFQNWNFLVLKMLP